MSENINELDLTDEELAIVVATYYNFVGGHADARNSLERKLHAAFEDAFGQTPYTAFRNSGLTNKRSIMWSQDVVSAVKSWTTPPLPPLPEGAKTMTFQYNGSERVVINPEINGSLLGGVEYTRSGRYTGQYKNYTLSKINR